MREICTFESEETGSKTVVGEFANWFSLSCTLVWPGGANFLLNCFKLGLGSRNCFNIFYSQLVAIFVCTKQLNHPCKVSGKSS